MKVSLNFSVLLIVASLSGLTSAQVYAELPADTTVDYLIREIPTNTSSEVVYTLRLHLTAVAEEGEEVAWEVSRLDIIRPLQGSLPETVWTEAWPLVATTDGRWWVRHEDRENVRTLDFATPPLITGRADSSTPGVDRMGYFVEAGVCDGLCETLFNGNVTALNFSFQLENEDDPEAGGSNEPTEVPPTTGGLDHGV